MVLHVNTIFSYSTRWDDLGNNSANEKYFRLTRCLLGCWMQWNLSLITMKQLMVWTTGGLQWKENVRTVILHRKNIFIFLSNTGGKEITDAALSTWREGKPREEISFAQVLLRWNNCYSANFLRENFLWTLQNITSIHFSLNHWSLLVPSMRLGVCSLAGWLSAALLTSLSLFCPWSVPMWRLVCAMSFKEGVLWQDLRLGI